MKAIYEAEVKDLEELTSHTTEIKDLEEVTSHTTDNKETSADITLNNIEVSNDVDNIEENSIKETLEEIVKTNLPPFNQYNDFYDILKKINNQIKDISKHYPPVNKDLDKNHECARCRDRFADVLFLRTHGRLRTFAQRLFFGANFFNN